MWAHRRQPTRLPHPWDSPGKNTGVGYHFLLQCTKVKSESEVTQSSLTLSDPMDCSLPGSSIHRVFQARVLEWGAIAFSTFSLKWCPKWRRGNRERRECKDVYAVSILAQPRAMVQTERWQHPSKRIIPGSDHQWRKPRLTAGWSHWEEHVDLRKDFQVDIYKHSGEQRLLDWGPRKKEKKKKKSEAKEKNLLRNTLSPSSPPPEFMSHSFTFELWFRNKTSPRNPTTSCDVLDIL